MDIHEYQAKEILEEYGIKIPTGAISYSPEQAVYRAHEIGGKAWLVKAQVHAGGRGKAGGVKICHSEPEVLAAADHMFGRKLITHQTGEQGKGIYRVYVEGAVEIEKELYLGFVLDRSTQRIMLVTSGEGGMEIEEISEKKPESIVRCEVEPAVGLREFQAREIAFELGIDASLVQQLQKTLMGCYNAFRNLDATMLEINPLAITRDKSIIALDAKMTFDENALFRHPRIAELRDKSQEDPRERNAADRGLNYVGLTGEIGCIVNGAGLAMATMDTIKLAGGEPANFLDIGGGATPDRVTKAFKLILSDQRVKVILVNIFAGINRCDWVAQGVVDAMESLDFTHPVVVRLAGTNVEEGKEIIKKSKQPIIQADDLMEAATKSVQIWQNL